MQWGETTYEGNIVILNLHFLERILHFFFSFILIWFCENYVYQNNNAASKNPNPNCEIHLVQFCVQNKLCIT